MVPGPLKNATAQTPGPINGTSAPAVALDTANNRRLACDWLIDSAKAGAPDRS
jgi:hypothetical protein